MSTSDDLIERSLSLAAKKVPTQEALVDLAACCGRKRVSVLVARRRIQDSVGDAVGDVKTRALQLLDEVLKLGDWNLD